MSLFGIVYKATSPKGKVYIGVTTKSLNNRKSAHYSAAFKHAKNKFHIALTKYQKNSIIWEEIVSCFNYEDMKYLEKYFINYYNSYNKGYNSTLGGDGVPGLFITEERRKDLSLKSTGKNNPRFGVTLSDETKLKISKGNKGKIKGIKKFFTKEHCQNISKAKKGRPFKGKGVSFLNKKHTDNTKELMRDKSKTKINVYCKTTNIFYKSIISAANDNSIDFSFLSKKLRKANECCVKGLVFIKCLF